MNRRKQERFPFPDFGAWRRTLPTVTVVVVLTHALTGCFLTADKLDPALDIPASYREAHSTSVAGQPPLEWWREFRSAELTDLMEQAQAANLDIAVAVAQIVQADAQARIAGAALLPMLSASGNVTRSKSAGASFSTGGGAFSTPQTIYTAQLNASYVVDFWGRNRALLRAAEDSAIASRFARDVIALTVLASVANTYFTVLEGQDLLHTANENLTESIRLLKIVQDRFNNGTAAALDLVQQASLVAIQRASIPPLIEQIRQNKATLALLVGRAPEHLSVHGGSMYRLGLPRISPGLPSELLTRRPDIQQAEANLTGADANVEAARAAFFPTIQLTGQGGYESLALSALFTPASTFYTLAASATQPIFQGGQLLGELDLQKGVREQLLQTYRKSVLSAFTDVEKALVAAQQLIQQEELQRQAVAESRKALDLSEEKLRAGTIDLTTLIAVEQTLFAQQSTLAQVRFSRLEAIVALYQALGGGWETRKGTSLAGG